MGKKGLVMLNRSTATRSALLLNRRTATRRRKKGKKNYPNLTQTLSRTEKQYISFNPSIGTI